MVGDGGIEPLAQPPNSCYGQRVYSPQSGTSPLYNSFIL